MIISNCLINLALSEAHKSTHKQKIGCVIFKNKRILSKGYNTAQKSVKKLHPKFQGYPYSVHAEVAAIINAKKDLKGSSMLVIRINNKNQFRLSKPCSKCMSYIEYVEIKNVFYSIDEFPYIVSL